MRVILYRYHYIGYVRYIFSSNIYMYVGATKTGIRNYSLYLRTWFPRNTRPFVVNCIICTYLPTYLHVYAYILSRRGSVFLTPFSFSDRIILLILHSIRLCLRCFYNIVFLCNRVLRRIFL